MIWVNWGDYFAALRACYAAGYGFILPILLLFQVISARYETSYTILTTNRAFNDWPEIFNNDSTLTSALLDRLLHHAHTVVIEGSSYRMRDKQEKKTT